MLYRILVCDDDPAIARAIGIYLRAAGYEAVEAHDGLEALDICAKQTIHLVIMDIMMPGMDGLELIDQLKQDRFTKHIPHNQIGTLSSNTGKRQ